MTDPSAPQPQNTPPPPAYEAQAYPAAPQYPSAPQYQGGAPGPDAPVPGKMLGIVAFVLSFFVQLVALILGIVALVQSRKAGHKNGFALAAIIISVVIGVLAIIGVILFFTFFTTAGGDLYEQVEACLQDPSGTVVFGGVTMTCEEVLEQSGN
ncbi:DUF4190 domain-containing protein [Microbacterium sp.]|uniref:DUF4190 domain-containing protein n=1 Tax=Microbacterium sp. TaxID=51671 RepID=UPI003735460A